MAINVTCECGGRFRAKDSAQGRQAPCPRCSRPLIVQGERVPNHDVFISHSKEDKAIADAVCAALEARHIRCWIAPRDVPPGAEWAEAILNAINESRVMVLVFSAHSNKSEYVLREVHAAVENDCTIIPLRIEGIEPSPSMGFFIRVAHWLDAVTPPLETHLKNLAHGVEGILRAADRAAAPPPPAQPVQPSPPSSASPATAPAAAPLAAHASAGVASHTPDIVPASNAPGGDAAPTATHATSGASSRPPVGTADRANSGSSSSLLPWGLAALVCAGALAVVGFVMTKKSPISPPAGNSPALSLADSPPSEHPPAGAGVSQAAAPSARPTDSPSTPAPQSTTGAQGDGPTTSTVDLLGLARNADNQTINAARPGADGIAFGLSDGMRVIAFPYEPPEEYDFRVVYMLREGPEGFAMHCVGQGHPFTAEFGLWKNTCTGFALVNGKVLAENPTCRKRVTWFVPGRNYECVVKVRRTRVELWIDGELITGHQTDYSALSLHPSRPIQPATWLGVSSELSESQISKAEVVEISGAGKIAARTAAANRIVSASSQPQGPSPLGNRTARVNLFAIIDLDHDARDSRPVKDADGILFDAPLESFSGIEFPYAPPEEYDLEVRFAKVGAWNGLTLNCAHAGRQFSAVIDLRRKYAGFQMVARQALGSPNNPTRKESTEGWVRDAAEHVALVRVRKEGVKLLLDGAVASEWEQYDNMELPQTWRLVHKDSISMHVGKGTMCRVKSVAVTELSGPGRMLRP